MEKWIGLLCANVFLLKTTLPYTVGIVCTPFSDNVTPSINKRVKKKKIDVDCALTKFTPLKWVYVNTVNNAFN